MTEDTRPGMGWKKARGALKDVRPGVPAEQLIREARDAMWGDEAPIVAHATLDMIRNTVIDDLMGRAGDAVMQLNSGYQVKTWRVRDWLEQQKVTE